MGHMFQRTGFLRDLRQGADYFANPAFKPTHTGGVTFVHFVAIERASAGRLTLRWAY